MTSSPEAVGLPTSETEGPSAESDLGPRFEARRIIGRGSQKRVELARDLVLERDVAIARLPKDSMSDTDLATFRELYLQDRLGDHPHIVPFEEVVERECEYLLVSPYLPGGSLETLLASTPGRYLPTSRIIDICRDLCHALAHAHRRGIVHGDVKPANILFDEEGRAFLSDFGLARIESIPTTELRGTPTYLAPELIRGEEPSPASDLYAIGCIFYEALVGEPPFQGKSVADVLRLQESGQAADLRGLPRRLPLQLVLMIEQLLEKDPSARPVAAWDVMSALWGMSRARSAYDKGAPDADDTPKLVGRNHELPRLEGLRDRAKRGSPNITLISGEGGIGKTRLLRSVIDGGAKQGFIILYGAASPDWPLPYGPIVDALIQLSNHLSRFDQETANEIRDFLYITLDGETSSHADLQRGLRDERYAILLSGLQWITTAHPIMLVLEDLQHADSATLDILRYLALGVQTHDESKPFALSIMGTFRASSASDELKELAASIKVQEHGEQIELAPFGEPGCHTFLSALGLEHPSRRLIEDAYRFSHGNPLMLRELVRMLREKDALERSGGVTSTRLPIDELARPSSLTDWLSDRIDGFDPLSAATLAAAALGGFELDRKMFDEQVRAIGLDPDTLVRRAADARLLKLRNGRLSFYHPLVRDALAKRLKPDQRRVVHLRIAEKWQVAFHRDSRIRELEAARHLIAAGTLATPAVVAQHSERAARHSAHRFAWAEAAFFLEKALEHAHAPLDRARLHHEAARMHFYRLNADSCLEHYVRAIGILRTEKDLGLFLPVLSEYVRTRVWLGDSWPKGPVPEIEELRRGLESEEQADPILHMTLLAALFEYEFRFGDPERARQLGLEVAAYNQNVGDPSLQASTSVTLGSAAHHDLRIRDALTIWRRGAEQGDRSHDSVTTANCAQKARMACFRTGDFERIRESDELLRELSHARQLPGRSAVTSALEALLAVVRGDLDSTERCVEEAVDLLHRAKYPWALIIAAPALVYARALAGDLTGALRAVDLLLDPDISFADPQRVRTLVRTCRQLCNLYVGNQTGLPSAERARLLEYLKESAHHERSLFAACFAVEVACPSQDAQLAVAALPCLEKAESLGWVFTPTWPSFIPRLLGVAATLADDLILAERSFQKALEWTHRLELPVERGRTLLDFANMLALRNGEGDPERAAATAADAHRELAAYPKSRFATRAQKLQSYLQDHARA